MVKIMDTFIKRTNVKAGVVKTLQSTSQAKVRLVISEKNWLETSAVDQLKRTAELPGMCCGVGMPDLHPGKGQPIGAVFITQGQIYPHLVGSDIGCGMGLWKLEVSRRKLKLDKWERRLVDLDDSLPKEELEYWLNNTSLKANNSAMVEVNRKLGTIGGGNHFAEIQQVEEVFSQGELSALGLNQQSVVFLAHSGSRGLGQNILRNHVDEFGGKSLTNQKSNSKMGRRRLKSICSNMIMRSGGLWLIVSLLPNDFVSA